MTDFQSEFVFGLRGKRYQDFVDSIARPLIKGIIGTDDYEFINSEHHLSYQDFANTKNSIVSHIYNQFLNDIKKDKETGKVSFKKKVCISLDNRLCTETCPITGRKITAIKLAGVELVYFIYFDIKEFFNFVYGHKECLNELETTYISSNNESIPTQILGSSNLDNEIKLTKKTGFIHNINYDINNRKFAYVWTRIEDGIPLFYDYYDDLNYVQEGDFLDLYFVHGLKYPKYIEISQNQIEITNFVKRFEGKLSFPNNQSYAFINTDEGIAIFVKPKIAEDLIGNDGGIVECLAVLQDDGRWRAEYILI